MFAFFVKMITILKTNTKMTLGALIPIGFNRNISKVVFIFWSKYSMNFWYSIKTNVRFDMYVEE